MVAKDRGRIKRGSWGDKEYPPAGLRLWCEVAIAVIVFPFFLLLGILTRVWRR